jgi:pentatricopeptide repeat protein
VSSFLRNTQAWAKSGYRGAATRADQLLDKMEAKYLAGDVDLKPNTFTYNAVINALAKSGEAGAAARAERVLQNMVNRHKHGANGDVKPTTINFNTVRLLLFPSIQIPWIYLH